jgi:small-conductance mechanosensitive channel
MGIDALTLWQWITEQLAVLQVMLARPAVLVQIGVIVAALAVAWLVPHLLGQWLESLVPPSGTGAAAQRPPRSKWQVRSERWFRALSYTLFPILALILLGLALNSFADERRPYGLIESVIPLLWLLLLYRLFVGVGLASLPKVSAERYARRFVRPSFMILLLYFAERLLFQTLSINDISLFQIQGVGLGLGNLLNFLIVLLVSYVASWAVFEGVSRLLRRSQAEAGVRQTVSNVSRYAVLGLGVLAALGALGVNMSTLAWIGGGLSVGIGFGLQELFGNFVSGILLTVERSVRPGDVIEAAGHRGVVSEVGMRSTVIKTVDSTEVFIPNKELLTKPMTAFTYSDRTYRIKLVVAVAYDSDFDNVQSVLLEAIRRQPLILAEPEPDVSLVDLNPPYSANFSVAGYIQDYADSVRVQAQLNRMVHDALAQHHIEIPSRR